MLKAVSSSLSCVHTIHKLINPSLALSDRYS